MSRNAEETNNMLDRWAKVFDKSLAKPVPKTLTLKRSSTLELEDVQEDVIEDIDIDAGHVLAPPIHQESRSTLHVCSRHGRERTKILEQKPVKPSKSIQPKPVKPVRQTSFHAPTPKETSAVKSGNRAETSVQPAPKPEKCPQHEVKQELVKELSLDIGPLLSSSRPKRQNSSSQRKPLERERATESVKPAVPGGDPITLEVAKLGPDGIMACLQGFLLRFLLYDQPSIEHVKSMLRPMSPDRQKALITAMTKILWQAGGQQRATVVLPCGECNWATMDDYREDQLTEKLHQFRFTEFSQLERFTKKHLSFFESTNGNGCILFLYSVILSRSIERVTEDLGDPNSTLMGLHDSCSQAMISLMLTGRAAANVFNGDIEFNKRGRKLPHPLNGIKGRSEIGFLSLEEHLDPKSFQVGSMLKTPKFPVWVVKTGERYGVLFSLNKELVNDWKLERRFELLYCTGSAKRNNGADESVFIIDTRDIFSSDDEFGEEPSEVEHCLRTK
ncbi:probable ubiquitin carboxyl-terminal hydrolase MINDY-4 isoform X3 [Pocillopora damicornis]|uniref:probable ubiquitin carboxyl-terminal hydrolase MINDY-4 isoform X3 n=1 Tax=Pocillopora damicornis TaxID=46731 RepID=UPI000F54E9B6|nr:probable ubiquitin carboxyl-terminal hydrolase MINDY-4 isoform X3 [Pocillopora damicornis]